MSRPVARYRYSRRYLLFAVVALVGAAVSVWAGIRWSADGWRYVSLLVAAAFIATSVAIAVKVVRPVVEIFETHILIGRRRIPWNSIKSVDQTSWVSPLMLRLGLEGEESLLLVYPGDPDSSAALLRHIRRNARQATLDGIPYRQFWGETTAHTRREPIPTRYPLLRPEDEREVEQMFQRLKAAGRIDSRGDDSAEE